MAYLEEVLEQQGLSVERVAERAKLPVSRMLAILDGRWTPSPSDRARIAAVLEVDVSQIAWGHTMPPRNVRYHRFGQRGGFGQEYGDRGDAGDAGDSADEGDEQAADG